MNDTMALNELADLFSVLGNPDRLRILFELRGGPKDVATIVEAAGTSQSRTSQHLGLLKAHHLVVAERDGRRVFYRLREEQLPAWLTGGFNHLATSQTHGLPLQHSIEAFRDRYQ